MTDETPFGFCHCGCGRKTVIASRAWKKRGILKGQPLNYITGHSGHRHGGHGTPEYHVWEHIIQRCTKPTCKGWKNYGGRGISICSEWRKDFATFLAYVGPRPSPKHSIDRYPNNDGNYEPGNVRWATRHEQARNTRRNRWITHLGRTATMAQWAAELGVHPDNLRRRLNKGSFPGSLACK